MNINIKMLSYKICSFNIVTFLSKKQLECILQENDTAALKMTAGYSIENSSLGKIPDKKETLEG
ncbi:hypothetical protein RG963_06290 [Methanosarcina sp. Z-7115]|uniref:Mobile element protein n=1 Tax=Methanosarcina baikalica TaxID=3073890 RepID=A0ABU2D089_9EURY|nr:hypothetical protein [Methanosarcina sp. Z-7115]MDR7665398.1 hypothetical protein [Methanosarcina sp. Z-7115]